MKYRYLKRVLDILISLLFLLLFWWLILLACLITLLDIGRPIIDIRLPREGKNKRPFSMYKIRTRVYDKQGNSTYTKTSRIIDKIGWNELPQFINVLKGDMSIIGPRAFICGEPLPDGEISPKRYLVKPGIISLAQSLGGRQLSYLETLKCDEIYYDHFGLKQDVKIFFKSIVVIIKQIIH